MWTRPVAALALAMAMSTTDAATVNTSSTTGGSDGTRMIFNFNSAAEFGPEDAAAWYESSDTVRTAGMSKASFSLQRSRLFQRAVVFALLNPQPNGAAFAGVKVDGAVAGEGEDWAGLELRLRARGNLAYWKVVLTDSQFLGLTQLYTYEAKFPVETEAEQFTTVRLPFTQFRALYRGQEVEDAPPLDLQKIGAVGLQAFGGVYDQFKQSGVGSLELDYIALY